MTAEEIRALRKALGLTQRQLADKVGVHESAVSQWERGARKPGKWSLHQLSRLAKKRRK